MKLSGTPSQTVGPFFHPALSWADGPHVVPAGTEQAIWIRGQVLDGAGDAVSDALVETWQADPKGRFAHPEDPRAPQASPSFHGFGRCPTDGSGRFGILTVKPGRVPDRNGQLQAPHIAVSILARGLLHRVVTRIYFADEADASREDSLLASLPKERRATLMATAEAGGYRFDIHLSGEHETIFFAV